MAVVVSWPVILAQFEQRRLLGAQLHLRAAQRHR
jgi:hypothetical protein